MGQSFTTVLTEPRFLEGILDQLLGVGMLNGRDLNLVGRSSTQMHLFEWGQVLL